MHERITIVDEISTRLKAARLEKGWSQAQLADEAGVSQSAIGNIESGQRKRPRDVVSLAAALGVTAEWLETGRGAQTARVSNGGRGESDQIAIRPAIELLARLAAQQRPTLRKNLGNLLVDLVEHPDDDAVVEQTITDIEKFFGSAA